MRDIKNKSFMSPWIASEKTLLAMTKKRMSLRAKRSNPEIRGFKYDEYICAALVSLFFHGGLAAFFIPSFLKVSPEGPVSFEVAWVAPPPPCQLPSSPSHSSPCHPRVGGDPEKNRTVIPNLFRDPVHKKMLNDPGSSPGLKVQHDKAPLDPRLRGDDKKGGDDDKKEDADGKSNRHGEAPKELKPSRKRIKTKLFRYARNDDVHRTQSHQPLPSYPWVCRKRGQEGVVCLYVKTNKEGHVIEAHLHKSSGHDLLDKAALEAVKSWTFSERNFQKTLSIAFRLKEEKVSFS